jgi:uncharacterized protein YqgV (UPF0045/DUF77 family)
MKITVDLSMYPLDADYKMPIKAFIRRLREYSDLELVTNQMSTQIRGDHAQVLAAVNACMTEAMQDEGRVVFVARYINADLNIAELPDIG